jgi:peptidoglycan/LPS O-acetylase OafA/YrhL
MARLDTENPRVLANLQICRALAAVIVVIGHGLHDVDTIAARAGIPAEHAFVNWGAGVDMFFVISGFIMVHVAGGEFAKTGASGRFLLNRLIRVVPLYWTITTALILGSWLAPRLLNVPIGGAWHIIASYLFIPDWRADHSSIRPVMALGWTLNFEILFYAAFAAAMLLPFRRGLIALASVFTAAVAAQALVKSDQTQIAFWCDPVLFEFLFGAAIGCAYRAGWRLSMGAALAMGAIGFSLLLADLTALLTLPPRTSFLTSGLPAMMVVAAAALGPELRRGLALSTGVAVGNASYALYLIHPFVIRPMREVWSKTGAASLPLWMFTAVCATLAILIALGIHRWLETPATAWLRRFTKRGDASRAARRLAAIQERPATRIAAARA